MTQTVFITGATGFIGRVVSAKAVQQGYNVRGLSRREEGDQLLQSLGVTPVRGELTNAEVLSREAKNADIVLHLAFDHDFSKPFQDLVNTDIAAVNALATPLVGTNKRLVITSGTGFAQPDPQGGETFEDSPSANGPLVVRLQSEVNALSYAQKGVHVNVIRLPQYVYGRSNKTGFAAQLIKRAIDDGQSFYLNDGAHCFSEVYVDDAADLYLLVAQKAASGEIFNGTGKTTTSYRQLATAIGELVHVPTKSVSPEEALAQYGPFFTAFVSVANRASNRKAVEKLGWRPVGPHLLTEIKTGSYVGVAEEFKNKAK
ncbi:hypothetical protein EMPS_04702 [Entomortierella parvispora]|uniref:NAD-dependent epimerase/dehydratase domain-containing protein n=1 Tax=Entomortierella parvispora TaxID=205924 RepID=A0A9P3H908_9FUNG|nr:hypothetical protein EMPS_04702 [Entomortierella parvispora]